MTLLCSSAWINGDGTGHAGGGDWGLVVVDRGGAVLHCS